MAKFARDCLHKVNNITNNLSSKLGEDTRELGFRVGLHSGQVTAGVLRGDKGRFQLFGDTGKANQFGMTLCVCVPFCCVSSSWYLTIICVQYTI